MSYEPETPPDPRRRRLLLAAAAGLVAIAVLVGVLVAVGGDDAGSEDRLAGDATTTTVTTVTLSPTTAVPTTSVVPSTTAPVAPAPTTSAEPTTPAPPTRPPTTSPTGRPTPPATMPPSCNASGDAECADGQPGWQGDINDSCHVLDAPEGKASVEIVPGLTARYEVQEAAVVGGSAFASSVVLTNTTDQGFSVEIGFYNGGPAVVGGRFIDTDLPSTINDSAVVVPAGQTVRNAAPAGRATTCGDVKSDGDQPLASGTYDVVHFLDVDRVNTLPAPPGDIGESVEVSYVALSGGRLTVS